jgi:hypothetical protein
MTTNTHASKKTAHHTSDAATATSATIPKESAAAPAAAATTPSAPPLVSFPVPPPLSSINAAPAGFVGGPRARFRGVIPHEAELSALPAALADLGKISDYSKFVGAPPLAYLIAILTLAGEWSAVRNATSNFDDYAATQEGSVWESVRPLMDDFRAALAQAEKADPTLSSRVQGITKLLAVRSVVAQKGAETKRANAKQRAAGERPTHGKVGKKNLRAAEKAALAAADAKATSTSTSPEVPAPATAPAPAPQATATNGATHS